MRLVYQTEQSTHVLCDKSECKSIDQSLKGKAHHRNIKMLMEAAGEKAFVIFYLTV